MKDAFTKYSLIGLSCLPVQKTKEPIKGLKTWLGGVNSVTSYKDAFGIGILCGSISGGLECIDFDNHYGDAKEVISAFMNIPEIKHINESKVFIIETSMSGGFHLLYKCETVTGNQKLARRPMWDEKTHKFKPDAIIETRGEGGYFVAAPTPGYTVIRGNIENIPTITPRERDIILSNCKSFNTWIDRENNTEHENKDKPGDIYNEKHEAIGEALNSLRTAGWVDVGNNKWRRPGKKEGVSATFGKVAENVFYNFSSSAYPFEPGAAYKPFQIVTLLEYDGDFSAFAKILAEKYKDVTKSKIPEKKKPELIDKDRLFDILEKSFINTSISVPKPPIAMYIEDKSAFDIIERQRLFTLGNFSVITGKGKSKKTFLTSLIIAAAATGGIIQNKFYGSLPENKRTVLLFDTEQSGYDAWMTCKRVERIANNNVSMFEGFDLREYKPLERCEIIEYAIEKYKDSLGFVVIDGIADLAKAINDEEEATRIGSMLLRLTKQYNIHILTVIHQNKGDNYATGHLGSMLIKKAEAVISVERDAKNKTRSIVSCDNMRGAADFELFAMDIKDHLPVIPDNFNPLAYTKATGF